MPRFTFNERVVVQDAAATVYEEGSTHDLPTASCEHWRIRGKGEYAQDQRAQPEQVQPPQPEAPPPPKPDARIPGDEGKADPADGTTDGKEGTADSTKGTAEGETGTADGKEGGTQPAVRAEHAGRGKWNVIGPNGEKINTEPLSKEQADEMVAGFTGAA